MGADVGAHDGGDLGAAIRARRRELGLTQEGLAARIGNGVRQADVSRLERGGVALPRRERLFAIAGALDLAPGELLARSGWGWPGWDAGPTPEVEPPASPGASSAGVAPPPTGAATLPEAPARPGGPPLRPGGVPTADLRLALERARETRDRATATIRDAQRTCALATEAIGGVARQGGRE